MGALGIYLDEAFIGRGFVMQAILASARHTKAEATLSRNSVWVDGAPNTLGWFIAARVVQPYAMRLFD